MDTALKTAIRAILAPLVRYLIGQGVTYPALAEVLKEVYVGAGEHHDGADSSTFTDSRVSLLTGIHRKDVKRLRAQADAPAPGLRRGASLAARAVAAWVSTPRFLDRDGHPRVLPRRAGAHRASFEALVRAIKADVRPNVILEELVRVGVAAREANDTVRLLKPAYVSALPEDQLAFLGANVGDHLRAALHNVAGAGAPFLERAVYYEALAPEALAPVRPALLALAEDFLRDANARVMPLNAAALATPTRDIRRMRLGIYYYEDVSRTESGQSQRRGGRKKPHDDTH